MVLMDVLSVRNVYEDAERAKDKKAPIGADVTIENFTDETVNALDMIDDLDDLNKQTKNDLLKVGVDTDEKNRSGSFLQVDQSNIFTNNSMSNSVEVMNIGVALDKYKWLEDYIWNVVKPDADKYTAKTALREKEDGINSGYFVRSLPGTREVMPVQACMFIGEEGIMQTAHNVIIAEENSELHLITGCATGDDISSAMHVGVSEMYLKPGAKITFTMVHNWTMPGRRFLVFGCRRPVQPVRASTSTISTRTRPGSAARSAAVRSWSSRCASTARSAEALSRANSSPAASVAARRIGISPPSFEAASAEPASITSLKRRAPLTRSASTIGTVISSMGTRYRPSPAAAPPPDACAPPPGSGNAASPSATSVSRRKILSSDIDARRPHRAPIPL